MTICLSVTQEALHTYCSSEGFVLGVSWGKHGWGVCLKSVLSIVIPAHEYYICNI